MLVFSGALSYSKGITTKLVHIYGQGVFVWLVYQETCPTSLCYKHRTFFFFFMTFCVHWFSPRVKTTKAAHIYSQRTFKCPLNNANWSVCIWITFWTSFGALVVTTPVYIHSQMAVSWLSRHEIWPTSLRYISQTRFTGPRRPLVSLWYRPKIFPSQCTAIAHGLLFGFRVMKISSFVSEIHSDHGFWRYRPFSYDQAVKQPRQRTPMARTLPFVFLTHSFKN